MLAQETDGPQAGRGSRGHGPGPVVAAKACAVPCTPKAAASAMASGSARVTRARGVRFTLHGEGPAGDC